MTDTKKIKIKGTIESAGSSGGAYIPMPFDVKKHFGSGRPKIIARFNDGITYRGTLVKHGTPYHFLLMRKDIREKLEVAVGDEVEVTLELDTKPRTVSIPGALKLAFTQHPEAEEQFKKLSYTHQKEYVQYITEAKREETRIRRVRKTIEILEKEIKTPK